MSNSNDNDVSLVCQIDHPLFDLIDNVTRRQVLRLIACESNYGNRIASIMDLSTPAVHRHLKYLQGKNPGDLALITEGKKTKKSHSGRKGGEAQLFKVDAKIGLFFNIFPNFVHNHILELHEENRQIIKEEEGEIEKLKYLEPKEIDTDWEDNSPQEIINHIQSLQVVKESKRLKEIEKIGSDKLKGSFYTLYKTVQEYNKRIRKMEEELMKELSLKNDFMFVVDTILKAQTDLEYEDRVIMRAITCLGKQCSSDLSHLLNLDTFMIERFVKKLRENDWIAE